MIALAVSVRQYASLLRLVEATKLRDQKAEAETMAHRLAARLRLLDGDEDATLFAPLRANVMTLIKELDANEQSRLDEIPGALVTAAATARLIHPGESELEDK